jgi:hypothetical protein
MMRLSASVRFTWSPAPGPAVGGSGGLPLGFLPVAAALAGLLTGLPFLRPRLDGRARFGDLHQALLAPCQLVRDRQAVRHIILIGRVGLGHQRSHLGLQLRFNLARVLVRQRAVAAGVGVDLGAVERDRAHLQHAHLARQQQHLHEQCLDRLEKAPPERGDGVVIGVLVGGDEAKRHRIIGGPLQLAAGEHARGVAVDQNAQQDRRVVRGFARATVAAHHRPQIQACDHLHHEPR